MGLSNEILHAEIGYVDEDFQYAVMDTDDEDNTVEFNNEAKVNVRHAAVDRVDDDDVIFVGQYRRADDERAPRIEVADVRVVEAEARANEAETRSNEAERRLSDQVERTSCPVCTEDLLENQTIRWSFELFELCSMIGGNEAMVQR